MTSILMSNRFKVIVIILGSILFSYNLWGNNLSAKWGVVDDHEIMSYLGNDGTVKIIEIPKLLLNTEVGQPGSSLRYRPSYYIIRIMEAFLWGNSPFLWYGFRLILFAASIGILWWIAASYIGLITGFLFMLFVCAFPFWSDVWARLGPAEIYAVFGTAIYCLGYINIFSLMKNDVINKTYSYSWINWTIMFLGALISMGSKENFLILLIPSVILLVFLYRKRLLDKLSFVYSLLIFGYGAFIGLAILSGLLKAKRDIYAQSVDPVSRLALVSNGMKRFFMNSQILLTCFIGVIFIIIILLLYVLNQKDRDKIQLVKKAIARYIIASIIILLFYISQYVFYAGHWPRGNRYDFPGVLTGPFIMLITVYFLLNISRGFKYPRMVHNIILGLFSLLLIFFIAQNGYGSLRRASQVNSYRTQVFTKKLTYLVDILKKDPESDLLFESYSPEDYEPLMSVTIFLRTYGVNNPFYMKIYTDMSIYGRSELYAQLMKTLQDVSINGGERSGWDFMPISKLEDNNCYSISFSAPPSLQCKRIGRIW